MRQPLSLCLLALSWLGLSAAPAGLARAAADAAAAYPAHQVTLIVPTAPGGDERGSQLSSAVDVLRAMDDLHR